MAALAPSLSTAPVVPSPTVTLSPKANKEEEEAPFAPVSSSYRYMKVDFAAVPQIKGKDNIKEWAQKWENFCNDQLPRERFPNLESWRNKVKVCYDKIENMVVSADIQRLLGRSVCAESIPRALKKEYGLVTFNVESKIALRIQFFPYHCEKLDRDGLPVVRSGLVFSYYTIHKRLDQLLSDAAKEKYRIDEDSLVPNILNSFTREQCKEILRALPDNVFEEADNIAELDDLSLSRIKFLLLQKILKKFALTDSPQTEQKQEREKDDEGGEVERVGAAGEKEDSRWVWRKKFPVADTGCSRHLIRGDLEDSIVSCRPREFRYEEASGGEMVCAEEVEAVPVLKGVDGDLVCPLFKGAFKSQKDEEDMHGVQGFFGGIESSNVVVVIVQKKNGWKLIRVPPSSVSLIAWRGIDGIAYKSVLSSLFLSSSGDSGVSLGSGKGGGVGSGAEENDAFSDVDVEEVQDADDAPSAGSQIQNGQLEMHVEQEGGKEKEKTEGNEEHMGPRRARREGREDGAMPPFPVVSEVSGIWIGREEDALCVQEVEKEKEKEEVHVAPEDEKEKEDEEEALSERFGELKERLVQVIREKEKRRRPLPRVVPIDAEIQKKMMDHVNPRKGHIDATAEEVAGGSHEGRIRSELERF
uniref:Uncharacterized protein n=1 Tax=Chromera velia CCMP2878 TaxID=1169474 RepID=A0A0G4GNX2_9ALVE|eukprot:Cvel_4975.t1-p1 / transcript=Cvel_4975.t1 / gene=Cvel_4975 / organism=Chromera_velia_CCMP2878 / gene_product=hypothetical protein / transcript_product=hypothetical protein / location=Cvel_scaffold225:18830-22316(+) / protein_length=640 / sequence_SO=supercontig / SO=protein_coding / is_pseudo=false